MNTLEAQLRRCTRSWRAFAGAAVTSAVLFLAIASTSIVIEQPPPRDEPPLTSAFVPPPPIPERQKTTPPLSSSLAESFKFDPTVAGPPPEIPLDLLDINLQPGIDPGLAVTMDMQRTFSVQKPDTSSQLVIFERDEVDEIPEWLYGPMPRIPGRLQKSDCTALVLYSVSEKGRPENIHVLDVSDPELVQGLKDAIPEWRFRPARKGGKAVKVWVQQPVNYHPDSKSPFTI